MRRAAAVGMLVCAAWAGGSGCDGGAGADDDDTVDSGALDAGELDAASGAPGASMGRFDLTYDWVAAAADYPGAATTALDDRQCAALARLRLAQITVHAGGARCP